MPHTSADEAIPKLRAALQRDPVLSFAPAFVRDHPGARLYLVGGAVRDALLGRAAKDADFVACGRPRREIERWFGARGKVDLVGASFGVYKFLPDGVSAREHPAVDVALPRREHASAGSLGGYRDFDAQVDHALPIEEDLMRRDFTVNAMAFDVGSGELVDPSGGLADLRGGLIRAVGAAKDRFGEDLSRVLRAVRFACELGFEIEGGTWLAACDRAVELNRKRLVEGTARFVLPRETVGEELSKAFLANPSQAADLLMRSGALRELVPEAERAARDPGYLGPLGRLAPGGLVAALALLMRAVPPEEAAAALRRAGFDTLPSGSPLRADLGEVAWIVGRLRDPESAKEEMRPSAFERAFMNGHANGYLAALRALGQEARADEAAERARAMRHRWGLGDDERIPALLGGDDALAAGLAPGPRVRLALDAARDAQLDGQLMTRAAALKWLKAHIGTAF